MLRLGEGKNSYYIGATCTDGKTINIVPLLDASECELVIAEIKADSYIEALENYDVLNWVKYEYSEKN